MSRLVILVSLLILGFVTLDKQNLLAESDQLEVITRAGAEKKHPSQKKTLQNSSKKTLQIFSGPEPFAYILGGVAEGTRTITGGKTSAWYGHPDPGDGLWNIGSFSVSCARFFPSGGCPFEGSPEKAEAWYLKKMQVNGNHLRTRRKQLGLELDAYEAANAVDLLVQSPLAALGDSNNPGYLDHLKKALTGKAPDSVLKQVGCSASEFNSFFAKRNPILEARVMSYYNFSRGVFERTPVLAGCNLVYDQQRSQIAVETAINYRLKI